MKKNIHCINPNCFDDNCHGSCESKDMDMNEEHWDSLARDFSLKKEESDQEDQHYARNVKMKNPIGEKLLLVVGWIAVSPFVIQHYVIEGFKWIVKKIKKDKI